MRQKQGWERGQGRVLQENQNKEKYGEQKSRLERYTECFCWIRETRGCLHKQTESMWKCCELWSADSAHREGEICSVTLRRNVLPAFCYSLSECLHNVSTIQVLNTHLPIRCLHQPSVTTNVSTTSPQLKHLLCVIILHKTVIGNPQPLEKKKRSIFIYFSTRPLWFPVSDIWNLKPFLWEENLQC